MGEHTHAFGLKRGFCIFCGIHKSSPLASKPCRGATTGTIIRIPEELRSTR